MCKSVSLSRLGAVTLQVIDPGMRILVALRALTGDGQLSNPRPVGASWRGLKGYVDVLGLFGGEGVHCSDSKTGVVHLGAE